MNSRTSLLAFALLCLPATTASAEDRQPLLRFPDIHGDTVVFSHGEDLWKASVAGGPAVRLTIHDGAERYPRFSPDGSLIAFSGEYDGNTDIYVMNTDGGDIRRVTWHPGADVMVDWHPVSGKILFRSGRNSYSRFDRLFLVAPDGSGLEELPLHEAAWGSYSPDGSKIAYNRVRREGRTWKRYVGGLAQDVWLYDFDSGQDRRLTEFEGTDRLPMWIGNRIFFSSDRTRTLNLHAYDVETGSIEAMTGHQEYDVRRPSMGTGRIVYEMGGQLWVLDTRSGAAMGLNIEIRADAPETRPYRKDVSDEVTQASCAPGGQRALVVARGEVFSVPRKHGPTRNLTRSSGSRQKDAVWSPDGKRAAWLSDESGEYAIHLADPKGQERSVQLTHHADGYRHTLRWSPDSTRIAFADQTLRFFYVEVDSGKVVEVDRSLSEPVDIGLDLKPIHDYQWSPDSRFLVWSRIDADLVSRVYVRSLEDGTNHRISGDLFNDFGPTFTADGKHLLFVSNRRFDPTFCDFEWEMVYKKVAGVYAITLAADGQPLLPPRSDEGEEKTEEEDEAGKKDEGDGDANVRIDFDGIAMRIEPLPLPRGNYRDLVAAKGGFFYLDKDEGDFNRFEYRAVGPRDLHYFDYEKRKSNKVTSGVTRYQASPDGGTLVLLKGSAVALMDASGAEGDGDDLDLSGLEMEYEPLAEWRQIYDEAWRMERDFYYEPGMHGLDWKAVGEKYGRLVASASCRQDLGYLIGEMIGELNTSHTYVFGGDQKRSADRVGVGLLGADWQLDPSSNRYRLVKILSVPDWTQGVHPPLARPGVDAQVGDYLIELDGEEVTGDRNLYAWFEGTAGKQLRLGFSQQPSRDGMRVSTVTPAGSERVLRYRDWVEHNRQVVAQASGGRIGYLHLPDTYMGSAREFPKYFYSQTQKEGLLIDGRFNGGGLDPDIFLQRLGKPLLAWWTRRYSMKQTTPTVVTTAHLALLSNRQAGSGGDMLPMEFQQKKLGPVIGTRTWGGLVGVSNFMTLVDGGGLTAPDYRIYDDQGQWVVENEGVTPDLIVELEPAEMASGRDAQLMKGVEVLLEKIEKEPRRVPDHEPFPRDG